MEHSDDVRAQLAEINRKLDYVVDRQRYVEELIHEMMPVVKEVLNVGAAKFQEYEDKGYFAVGSELMGMADRVVTNYGPDEVHKLSDSIVAILDTVRNLTTPDVLEVVNDAGDVLHHADEVKPVGMFGAVKATRDDDVQRGMAIALEILRHLGQSHGGAGVEVRRSAATAAAPTRRAAAPTETDDVVDAVVDTPAAPEPDPDEVVEWEGHRFNAEGFLLDPAEWSPELATKMAAGLGIELTDDHWTVIRWARADYLANGASPNVRRVASGSGLGTRRVYELYPKSPGKTNAILAGIPKPVGCV